MTATSTPPGFFATLLSRTQAAFWAHYDKALQLLLAAAFSSATIYFTAWMGALPTPTAAPPSAVAPRVEPPSTAALEAVIQKLDSRIEKLLTEMEKQQQRKRPLPPSPK